MIYLKKRQQKHGNGRKKVNLLDGSLMGKLPMANIYGI